MNARRLIPALLVAALGCSASSPPAPKVAEKTPVPVDAKPAPVAAGKNVWLEVQPDKSRWVVIDAEVCLREGPLEMLLCRKRSKEHEAILAAEIDARDVHKALLAAGAKVGSPVKFQPKFAPPTGTPIRIALEYTKDGKPVRVSARQWLRESKSKKDLDSDWVFAGSLFYADPDGADKPPLYAANGGDVICVSNFESAMLDLPVVSPNQNEELQFEAITERIPEVGTKVRVILEPIPEKK